MQQPPNLNDDGDSGRLEELLCDALAVLEFEGQNGLEQFLSQHPGEAAKLRTAVADLQRMQLIEQPPSQLPQSFGDFEIKGQLGAGGMGVVFLAEQTSLGREVALKVVRPELLLFEGARERFQREIEAVARLEHPAIVSILISGVADEVPYYVMPRLSGKNAETVALALADCDPRGLSGTDLQQAIASDGTEDPDGVFQGSYWQAVVKLVRKAALGIQHAHARGILHRDLKPSNLMLTANGQSIVLDFGLARARDDARLTRTGSTAGSPAYMAPEQVRGEPADERTDVYALAATMHCLLGLRPPFPVHDREQLRQRILASERQELRQRTGIPPELLMVINCAMDLERRHRYPSAQAFADDLLAVLVGQPIIARQLPLTVRARRFVQRHRTATVAAAVTLLFLALLPVVLLWQQQRAGEALSQQVHKTSAANTALQEANVSLQEQVARADRSVSVSIDSIERLLANVAKDKLRNLPATLAMGAQVLQDALELFAQLAPDERFRKRIELARLRTLTSLLEVEDTLGRLAAAGQTGQQVLHQIEAAFPENDLLPPGTRRLRAKAHRLLAGQSIKRDLRDSAQTHVDAARRDLEILVGIPKYRLDALEELSIVATVDSSLAMQDRDAVQAEAALRRAVSYAHQAQTPGKTSRTHQVARLNLCQFLRQTGRGPDALLLADEVLGELDQLPDVEYSWPVPRMVLAMARAQRFRALQFCDRKVDARTAFAPTIAALDDVIRDYPDAPDTRRLRAATRGNLARTLAITEDEFAESLLRLAIIDLEYVLQANPNDVTAHNFLIQQRRTFAYRLRRAQQWDDLEQIARDLGAMRGHGTHRETAARDLIRCASQPKSHSAEQLLDEAMVLLLASHRNGAKVLVDDALYAPLRDDPRFAELRGPK